MKDSIRSMQAKIRSLREMKEDVDAMASKIDAETEDVNRETEDALSVLKEKIRNDLEELMSYSDTDVYGTRSLDLYDGDDRYGIKEGGKYPAIHVKITFGGETYNFLKKGTIKSRISVSEWTHSYAPIFLDGGFADDQKDSYVWRYHRDTAEAFYRHWPGILAFAYEKMVKAYKDEAKKTLEEAAARKAAAYRRQMDILAALAAEDGE